MTIPFVPITVSTMLRKLRNERGLTQAALAAKAGTWQAHISEYETDYKVPSLDTRIKLARALDVPITDLIPA